MRTDFQNFSVFLHFLQFSEDDDNDDDDGDESLSILLHRLYVAVQKHDDSEEVVTNVVNYGKFRGEER